MVRSLLLLLLLLVSSSIAQPVWREALGDLSEVPAEQRLWFSKAPPFEVNPKPWGKSVAHYLSHWHNRPEEGRRVIVVRWLEAPDPRVPSEQIRRYLEAFFQLPVRLETDPEFVLPAENAYKHSADKIRASLRESLPEDAFCVIGLLRQDIYSEDNGPNHLLFGEGHYYDRTAVASVARLDTEEQALFTHRVFKLLTHELVHTFSVEHCGYFSCLMNPSGSLEGSDRRPLFLCPVCLRKQHAVLQFDPKKRYGSLWKALGSSLKSDRRWLENRTRGSFDIPSTHQI